MAFLASRQMLLKYVVGISCLLVSGSAVEAETDAGRYPAAQLAVQANPALQRSDASTSTRKPGDDLPVRFKWDWRYAQIEEFREFPSAIHQLLQQSAKERSLCRGGSGGNRSTLRACNRWDDVDFQLEKLGWCFGGSGGQAFRSWMRCEDDPTFRSETLREEAEPYFSEQEIAEAFEDEPEAIIREDLRLR